MNILYFDCNMGAAGDMFSAALYELLSEEEKKIFCSTLEKCFAGKEIDTDMEKSVKCGITGTHFKVKIKGVEEESHDHHHHDHDHGEYDHEHHHDHDDHDHHDHEHDHEHDEHDHEHEHDHGEHDHEHHHDHDEHDHEHHHHHTSLKDILDMVEGFAISDKIKADIMGIYKMIAEAESAAHGKEVSEIHFHEVGSMDAVVDITSGSILMNMISPDKVVVSPIHVGSGKVKCMHGIMPVPAPATAFILKGVPIYGGRIEGELCTPTGAALLRYYADEFGNMPIMAAEKIGYGMGKKDFAAANCLRVFLGQAKDATDKVYTLECNIDDMTGEDLSFAKDKLLKEGALDVFTTAIEMKKNRPGILLSVICRENDRKRMAECIFKYTTTIGIRQTEHDRFILERNEETISTTLGDVSVKFVSGYNTSRHKIEFSDLKKIAEKNDLSIAEVRQRLNEEIS